MPITLSKWQLTVAKAGTRYHSSVAITKTLAPNDIIGINRQLTPWHQVSWNAGRKRHIVHQYLRQWHTHTDTHTLTHLHWYSLTEEFNKAALAVGLVILLLESALVQLLEAESTNKVLRVELLAHGGDAAPRDGLLAARAQRAAALVVVRLAVRLPVVIKEAAVDEWCEALLGKI